MLTSICALMKDNSCSSHAICIGMYPRHCARLHVSEEHRSESLRLTTSGALRSLLCLLPPLDVTRAVHLFSVIVRRAGSKLRQVNKSLNFLNSSRLLKSESCIHITDTHGRPHTHTGSMFMDGVHCSVQYTGRKTP